MSGKRGHNEKGIDWKNSGARIILLNDLSDDALPIDETACPAEEAWAHYKELMEFSAVPFWQFEKQLRKHRESFKAKDARAMTLWNAYKEMRKRHNEPCTYDDGRRIFRHSEAFKSLRNDVFAGRHRGLTPAALRDEREEYREWPLDVFTQRVYQMERQWKFINYLEKKRAEKKEKEDAALLKAFEESITIAGKDTTNSGGSAKRTRSSVK